MAAEPSLARPLASYSSHADLRSYWVLLVRYLAGQWRRFSLAALLLLVGIGLQLLAPQALRIFIDTAKASESGHALVGAALLFLVAAIGSQFVIALAGYHSLAVGWSATNRLRADLALQVLSLDLAFHERHTTGELIERVDGDVALLADFFSHIFVNVGGNGLLLLGILILVSRQSLGTGLALSFYSGLVTLILRQVQRRGVPVLLALRQAGAELGGFLGEFLVAREDLVASGAARYVLHRFSRLQLRLGSAAVHMQAMICAVGGSLSLLLALGSALVLTLGAWELTHGTMTLGMVFLLYSYTTLLVDRLAELNQQLDGLQQATASLSRIAELFAPRPPPVEEIPGDTLSRVRSGPLSLTFEQVTFGYEPGQTPNLAAVTFEVAPEEVVGLVGRTGSGKTSIMRLVFRFYDPDAGIIRLGGQDIRRMPRQTLRRCIGLVTQEVQIFQASVRDNLTFFSTGVADERLLVAITQLGLEEWYARLLYGLDTQLSPESISAGEAQLIAFARVLLRDPQLIILDEASSRLDPATERLVMRATSALLANRTGLIIAHRLTTLESVDRVLVLESGRLVEDGPRETLARNTSSYYARLLQSERAGSLLV